MKVIKEKSSDIRLLDMKCGQIAVVTQWDTDVSVVGEVVQRYKDSMIILGTSAGECYPSIFIAEHVTHRVRILDKGTQIEI